MKTKFQGLLYNQMGFVIIFFYQSDFYCKSLPKPQKLKVMIHNKNQIGMKKESPITLFDYSIGLEILFSQKK